MFIENPGNSKEENYRAFFTDVLNSISIDNKNEFHEVIIGICSVYYGKDLNGKLSSKIIKVIGEIQKLYQDASSNERKIQMIFQECIRTKLDTMIHISTSRNLDEMQNSSSNKVLSRSFYEFIWSLPFQDRLDISLCLHQTLMSLSLVHQDRTIEWMSVFLKRCKTMNIPSSCQIEWMYLVCHLFKGSEESFDSLAYHLSSFLQLFYLKDYNFALLELGQLYVTNDFLFFCMELIFNILKDDDFDFIDKIFIKVKEVILSFSQNSMKQLEDINQTIYREISQSIKQYPVYYFNRDSYMMVSGGEIMARNMNDLAVFHIVKKAQQSRETLLEDLLVELGEFRHILALHQRTIDSKQFGIKRTQILYTPFRKMSSYREYHFILLARLEDRFLLFSQKASVDRTENFKEKRDLSILGYTYSIEIQEKEIEGNLGLNIDEFLEKEDQKVKISSYEFREKLQTIVLLHQDDRWDTQMKSWMKESLEHCFLSHQDEQDLILRVALFRYLFSYRTPYTRGSAMVGEWIEKGIYQYHGYDLEYGYPEVRNKRQPLADLDAFSSLGLSYFLDQYCRKTHLKKMQVPPPKEDLSSIDPSLQTFIIEKYAKWNGNQTDF